MEKMHDTALLKVDEMYRADAHAVAMGVPSLELMENAGRAIATTIEDRWAPTPVAILCGPGNNGGDGFVVARLLAARGWAVRVALLGDVAALKGDAKINADQWTGAIEPMSVAVLDDAGLIVDALFGAGLSRPIEGACADVLASAADKGVPCVGVDTPSGVHGDTGEIMGTAIAMALTVTFFRAKPAHVLMPGRDLAGEIVIADIGIPESVLDEISPRAAINAPAHWLTGFPWPESDGHKYRRGHAAIAGGPVMTGAARLVALAARRIGAGLVSIAAPENAAAVYQAAEPGNLIQAITGSEDFRTLLDDRRKNAVLVGPGAGQGEKTRNLVLAALSAGKGAVIDADGLTSFSENPSALFDCVNGPCVFTPHDGEFAQLFDTTGSKLERARRAAAQSGAVIVLKGADTVIAAPGGRAIVNTSGTPYLATAGSGDVLAGLIIGLMTQEMAAFDAAACAAWIHGRAAEWFGPGLIAEDLVGQIPDVLEELQVYEN